MTVDPVAAVAARILDYLQRNPRAADTVEGVHYAWLSAAADDLSLDLTQAALDLLFAQRKVDRVPVGDRLLWRAQQP